MSECPGYIWVTSVLWHRGVTFPYCARTGTLLRVPQLALCCPSLKCDSPVWKITSPITPAASLLSLSPPVNVLTWPTESPEGETESPESLLQFFFQKHDNRPRRQGLAFSPFLGLPVQHAGSKMPSEGYDHQSGHCLNATVSLMCGRFIYECAEICLWRGSLSTWYTVT